VASRLIYSSLFEQEFERTCNELFERILIRNWRSPVRVRSLGNAVVAEDEEAYRVQLAVPGADPQKLTVDVSERRLTVRMGGVEGPLESTFDFSHHLDPERASARFEAGILEIILPKTIGRKIEVR